MIGVVMRGEDSVVVVFLFVFFNNEEWKGISRMNLNNPIY
jgi:hypothetical protein